MRTRASLLVLALVAACAACTTDEATLDDGRAFITLPPDFSDHAVATVGSPTAIAFTPDGRLLITTQQGKVRVYKNGALLATAAIDLGPSLCTNSERGLLGIAIDPDFSTNRHLYLYYTFKKYNSCTNNVIGTSPVNRVSRFTYNPANDTIAASTELVLVDNILALAGNHNGGDVHVGPDGKLYIAVGDSGCQIGGGNCGGGNGNAKFTSHLSGKILRVERTSGVPPTDNPLHDLAGSRRCGTPGTAPDYPNNNTKPCREIWAYGLRNPFRFAFKPGTTTWFINDVGQNVWEEIDNGVKGANYGWNTREGFCANGQTCTPGSPPAGLTNPIHAYSHSGGCASITGGAFVPSGAWAPGFDGDYLFGDYVCGKLFRLEQSGSQVTVTEFASAIGSSSVVSMRFGPGPGATPSLYYTTYGGGGQVRRIDYTGSAGNDAPTAVISAGPTAGPVPLVVDFDGSDSADPDPNDSIVTYRWNFGDGVSQDTSSATVSHTYTTAGQRTATLRVIDELGAISPAVSVIITPGGSPPTVSITSPASGATFTVGQVVTLTATASDAQDGTLPASALSWRVTKHHAEHTHPFFGPTSGNNLTITTDPPEDLLAATNSHLEIEVTATDSSGLSTTVGRTFNPRKVNLTFQTSPPGLTLLLDSTFATATPSTVVSWQAWGLRVRANDQVANGVNYVFQSWSDGGSREHVIATPASAATYTATFAPAGFAARVNFQPSTAPAYAGYLVDSGLAYGPRDNGFTYGWNAVNNETRDRNSTLSADQRYDTLNHLQKPSNPDASWEIAVPNGTYSVRIVAGDASHFDSVFRLRAESTLVVSGTPTTSSRWVDATATVTVSDGRLTISNGTGSSNNKICFVDVTQL